MEPTQDRSEIVFFDLETTLPPSVAIWEFGAILVCAKTLVEVNQPYSIIVQLNDPDFFSDLPARVDDMTRNEIRSGPTFAQIADTVYDILHGRIWAGHNILTHDCVVLKKAYEGIGKRAPVPKDTIDTLDFLSYNFGRRADRMKMASLAKYFHLPEQTHRSLDDVKLNLQVLRHCAAIMFMESSLPKIFTDGNFLEPGDVTISSLSASLIHPYQGGISTIKLLQNEVPLHIFCSDLKVRFGINSNYFDQAGRPKLSLVVDLPEKLCVLLYECDHVAKTAFSYSQSSSQWASVVDNRDRYPTVKLNIPYLSREGTKYATDIYQQESPNTTPRLLTSSEVGFEELHDLFPPGATMDAFFSFEFYDVVRDKKAGIRLVAKRLILFKTVGY